MINLKRSTQGTVYEV